MQGRIRLLVTSAFGPLKKVVVPVIILSAVLNILMLSGSFFMLLVYDEVLTSRSMPTLWGLLFIVTIVYMFQAVLDLIRGRVMIQVAALADQQLSPRIFDVVMRYERKHGPMREGGQPIRDLDQVRGYMSGNGPLALLDLPWVLLFLAILFIFHWILGVITIFGVVVLFGLALSGDRMTREQTGKVSSIASARYALAESSRRNADVIRALGMSKRTHQSWDEIGGSFLTENERLAAISGRMQSISKSFRMLLQSVVLAAGAALVLIGEATGGIIIAGSILSARALAPVEQTIASWKNFTAARQSWSRIATVLDDIPEESEPLQLPPPHKKLAVQNLVSGPPGIQQVTIMDISFNMYPGEVAAVVGPSGSGKSSLVKVIVGIWPALRGAVRLDGATLEQWNPDSLGEHIGYVPQIIELFDGTIAQNISRFDPDAATEDILEAAKAADVHDLIVQLKDGYEHMLGPMGGNLSSGQKQRIALARALYKNPFLVVLDEPNSNLDALGENALVSAIESCRDRGAIVLIVSHRPSTLTAVKYIILMKAGRISSMGSREDMMPKLFPQERKHDDKLRQKKILDAKSAAGNDVNNDDARKVEQKNQNNHVGETDNTDPEVAAKVEDEDSGSGKDVKSETGSVAYTVYPGAKEMKGSEDGALPEDGNNDKPHEDGKNVS